VLPENEVPNTDIPFIDVTGEIYKDMCALLYAYRFGRISFLELLDKFEEALNIKTPPTTSPQQQTKKE